jgi:excisionase family DNA binding protein
MQQLMTVKEYAALKAISENTVWRCIAKGEIKVERFGRAVRIDPQADAAGFENVNLPSYLNKELHKKKTKKDEGKRQSLLLNIDKDDDYV